MSLRDLVAKWREESERIDPLHRHGTRALLVRKINELEAALADTGTQAPQTFDGFVERELNIGEQTHPAVRQMILLAAEAAWNAALRSKVCPVSDSTLVERVLHAEAPDEPASFSCGCSEHSDGLLVVGNEYADKYGDGVCPRHGDARSLHMTKCGVCGCWHISQEERASLDDALRSMKGAGRG